MIFGENSSSSSSEDTSDEDDYINIMGSKVNEVDPNILSKEIVDYHNLLPKKDV